MARTATPKVTSEVTTPEPEIVTSEGNDAVEAPLSATTLAEIEAGKATLAKLAASQAAE